MIASAFAQSLAKLAILVRRCGDEKLGDEISRLASFFSGKKGSVASCLPPAGARPAGRHARLAEVLQASAELHRSVSPSSSAAADTDLLAAAIAASASSTVADTILVWEEPAKAPPKPKPKPNVPTVKPPAVDGKKSAEKAKKPAAALKSLRSDIVALYATILKNSPPVSAVTEVDRIEADRQVRLEEAKAIYFAVVGSAPPKGRKEVFEWLRRSVARERIYAEKESAIRRK